MAVNSDANFDVTENEQYFEIFEVADDFTKNRPAKVEEKITSNNPYEKDSRGSIRNNQCFQLYVVKRYLNTKN